MTAPTTTATARRSPAWPWLAVPLSLALGALSVVLAPRRIWTGSSDPSFYLGYALDYGDLAARYGQTYHGNRLSYLLPEMGAFALLGPERGYLVLRAVMLAVAALTVLLVAEPRIGRSAAVVVATAAVAAPLLAQQLFWTHYDGFAAVYLLVAAALLVGGHERRWRQYGAGLVLGLVVNANLAFLLFVGALGLAWLITLGGSLGRRSAGAGRVIAGVVVTELALSAMLQRLGPDGPWFIEVVPFRFARRHVGDDTWFTPLSGVLSASPFLLVVLAVLILSVLSVRDRGPFPGRDSAVLAAWWLGISLALLLLGHGAFRAGWLGLPAYTVLLAPGVLLGLVGIASAVMRHGRLRRPVVGVAAVAWSVVLFAAWAGSPLRWTVPLALAGTLAVCVALLRPQAAVAAALGMALLPAIVVPARSYAPSTGAPDFAARSEGEQLEWDIFRAIVQVQAIIGDEIPRDRDLVFWHEFGDVDGDLLTRINMVQYGRGVGRLHRDKGEIIGMPELPPVLVDELLLRRPVTVILIAWERPELLEGVVTLSTRVPGARQTLQQVIEGDVRDLHVALVEVD